MSLFIPITKVDVEQRLVYGTLSAEIPDKSGEILDYATAKPAFETWSNQFSEATGGKSLGNVRAMHGSIAAGKLTELSFDDDAKRVDGCAKIVDEAEWQKVLEGVYTGFSIGGGYAKRWTDPENPKLKRYTPTLSEVSIVDNPCVPTALFEVIKADGTVEMRKFITPDSNEDSMTTKATDNAAAAAEPVTDAAITKAAHADAPADGATDTKPAEPVVKVDTVKDGKAVKPKSAPMQKWVAGDGSQFDTKRDAELHNLQIEKRAELAPAMDEMNALLKSVTEDAPAEGTKPEEPSEEPKAAPVVKAADATAPVVKAVDKPVLKKGLWQIGELACLLGQLQNLQGSVEFEQMWEQDTASELPAKFKGLVSEMCQVLVALVNEETAELIADGEDVDVEVLEMAAKMAPAHAAALAKHVKGDKLKAELEKAGARHSQSDKEALMGLHKSACDHVDAIEKCFKGMGIMDDDANKSAEAKELTKMSKLIEQFNTQGADLLAVTKVATDQNDTLKKAVSLVEGLKTQNAELAKRVATLEEQPAPAKGHVKAISKSQDNGGTGDGKPTPEKVSADLSKLSEGERVHVLMKDALARPLSQQI